MILYSLAVISDRLQALTRRLDSEVAAPGRLRVFQGTVPSVRAEIPGDALELAILTFKKPSLDNVTGSKLTIRNPDPTLIRVTGDAAWGRMESGNGEFVAQGKMGVITLDNDIVEPGDFMIVGTTNRLFAGGELTILMATLEEV